MFPSHELHLPRELAFYSEERTFDVVVDNQACGNHQLDDGTPFTVPAPGPIGQLLTPKNGQPHTARLTEISEAALRFYRTGGIRSFALTDYLSFLFLTRYQFGQAFRESPTGSLEHVPPSESLLHSEVVKVQSELLAYGIALHFTAGLLNVPFDRFFFMSAAGARPDFHARVSPAELVAAGASVGVLTPSGIVLELEVKARRGWASFRADGGGIPLLHNLSEKSTGRPNHAFLGIIVGLPGVSGAARARAKIVVADPGDPEPLQHGDQLVLLLEESVPMLYRYGIWVTLLQVLRWLEDLRGLSEHEQELRESLHEYEHMERQYQLLTKEVGDRRFIGRVFTDVVYRLGRQGDRDLKLEEAEARLHFDNLGRAWYAGVDERFVEIVRQRNGEALLSFGLGVHPPSAFHLAEEPMADGLRASTRSALRQALLRW